MVGRTERLLRECGNPVGEAHRLPANGVVGTIRHFANYFPAVVGAQVERKGAVARLARQGDPYAPRSAVFREESQRSVGRSVLHGQQQVITVCRKVQAGFVVVQVMHRYGRLAGHAEEQSRKSGQRAGQVFRFHGFSGISVIQSKPAIIPSERGFRPVSSARSSSLPSRTVTWRRATGPATVTVSA